MSTPKKQEGIGSPSPKTATPKRVKTPLHKTEVRMETRSSKKARETLDLLTHKPQRQASLQNLLGPDLAGPSRNELETLFRIYDLDGDGHISSDELAAVMRSMGKRPITKKIQRVLEECDTDKNGTIELEEFIAYFQKLASEKNKAKRSKGSPEEGANEPKAKRKKGAQAKDEEAEAEENEALGGDTLYAIEKLLQVRDKADGSGREYLVKWEGYSSRFNTWEPDVNIDIPGNEELIEELEVQQKGKHTPKKGKKATLPALSRGGSIISYYNPSAGLHVVSGAAKDKHGNLEGPEYDLGQEGAFEQFTVLIGCFYVPLESQAAEFDLSPVTGALSSKGFDVNVVKTEKEFLDGLSGADVAWIISHKSLDGSVEEAEWRKGIQAFSDAGGGLWIWGENEPWFAQANATLSALFEGCQLSGSTPAAKDLILGDGSQGTFRKHLLTTGITTLFEGRTISVPTSVPDKLQVVATSTDGNPVILVSDPSKSSSSTGRIAVDTGFTKLWVHWDSAGTARYVKNVCVWLLGLDHRIANNAPLKGKLVAQAPQADKYIWQFEHNGWHKYDDAASDEVERVYQEFLTHPHLEVREVKSGHWHYRVDFTNMQQENMQHFAHTKRPVRRVKATTVPAPFGFSG